MWINTKTRRTPIRLIVGVICLVIAVFVWGVQYKKSLYDAPGSLSAAMPHAKLLSQKERPVSSVDLESLWVVPQPIESAISGSSFLVFAIMLSLHASAVVFVRFSVIGEDSPRKLRFASNYFSFRPPPVSIPSN